MKRSENRKNLLQRLGGKWDYESSDGYCFRNSQKEVLKDALKQEFLRERDLRYLYFQTTPLPCEVCGSKSVDDAQSQLFTESMAINESSDDIFMLKRSHLTFIWKEVLKDLGGRWQRVKGEGKAWLFPYYLWDVVPRALEHTFGVKPHMLDRCMIPPKDIDEDELY